MEFYENISSYYDSIFPSKKETLTFLKDSFFMKENGQTVIDLACGSGSYAIGLGSVATKVYGYDLDPYMISQANRKNKDDHVMFQSLNMLRLEMNKKEPVDFIFCIGNSLVHLKDEEEISGLFGQIYRLLREGGILVLQIVNYDRILDQKVTSLPSIHNKADGVTFYRDYKELDKGILFKTKLDIDRKEVKESFQQSVILFPIRTKVLIGLLESTGFGDIEIFGGFDGSKYQSQESFGVVVRCKKKT